MDLTAGVVQVMRSPGAGGYGERESVRPGDRLTIDALPGASIAVSDIFREREVTRVEAS
ncbi:MAG: hypothetical protein ACRDYY_05685 [Acidimicrobiales bacterium]